MDQQHSTLPKKYLCMLQLLQVTGYLKTEKKIVFTKIVLGSIWTKILKTVYVCYYFFIKV